MHETHRARVFWVRRRLLVALGALALLWLGLGQPGRHRAPHRAEWLTVDHLRLRALRAGAGDTTLLLLHGYGESLLTWRYLLDRVAPHYQILAIDLPGFGLSDKPDTSYDYPAYQRWLGDLLTGQTRGPIIVVGHSMGGQLAAGLALDHPDRVVAAVLIDPAGGGLTPLVTDSAGQVRSSAYWILSRIGYALPPHDKAWLREPSGGAGYELTADSNAAIAARRVVEQFDFAALAGRFAEIRQPVLLLWGRQDPTIPLSIGERIAATLPCRRFVVLQALHRPHQTVPDTVAAELNRFLTHPACDPR
ncbi:MAG: alpha/beta fold hydrolase [Gemmatimonadales bacterium]